MEGSKKPKLKYLFFNKLTLELVGVLEALAEHLGGGAVCLSDVTQTLLLQLTDLWDLVFTKSTTKSAEEHKVAHLRLYCRLQTTWLKSRVCHHSVCVCVCLLHVSEHKHCYCGVDADQSW